MKNVLIFWTLFLAVIGPAEALQVNQQMQTRIGVFDACELGLSYSFFGTKNYEVKTTLKTSGTFGVLYPFSAMYRAVGIYNKNDFKPDNYFYETQSRFRHRTKEIKYENGVPQERVSVKNEKIRTDKIETDDKYERSIDLLSTLGVLIEQVMREGSCDFKGYSFNGKKYSLSEVKKVRTEDIKTPFFEGTADKCSYSLEVLDDAEAGFLLSKDEPVYFWVMREKETNAPFVVKVLVENTPFGELESLTTNIEVKR